MVASSLRHLNKVCKEGRESPKCSINGDLNEVMKLFFSGSDEGLKWHPNL